jgi:xanthine dehydrogenase accessory factor
LPEEIALSIVSEMVLIRRGGDGLPLSKPQPARGL